MSLHQSTIIIIIIIFALVYTTKMFKLFSGKIDNKSRRWRKVRCFPRYLSLCTLEIMLRCAFSYKKNVQMAGYDCLFILVTC